MGAALANRAADGNVSGNLAHPPRWAAILDLCPILKIPPSACVSRVYLIHVDDGDAILIWGRAIFADQSESVGFVCPKTLKRLEAKHSGSLQWLSRIAKKMTRIEQNEPHKYAEGKVPPDWNKGRKGRKPPKKADIVEKARKLPR